jgi:hypothetical protein
MLSQCYYFSWEGVRENDMLLKSKGPHVHGQLPKPAGCPSAIRQAHA